MAIIVDTGTSIHQLRVLDLHKPTRLRRLQATTKDVIDRAGTNGVDFEARLDIGIDVVEVEIGIGIAIETEATKTSGTRTVPPLSNECRLRILLWRGIGRRHRLSLWTIPIRKEDLLDHRMDPVETSC